MLVEPAALPVTTTGTPAVELAGMVTDDGTVATPVLPETSDTVMADGDALESLSVAVWVPPTPTDSEDGEKLRFAETLTVWLAL